MLEEIVKAYVPFGGVYPSEGFDEGYRLTIPKPFVKILKERQKN